MYNDGNALCMGSGFTAIGEAKKIILTFLKTGYERKDRRDRRIKKLDMIKCFDR
jgi:ribose 5-phosphate isomerase RpiB